MRERERERMWVSEKESECKGVVGSLCIAGRRLHGPPELHGGPLQTHLIIEMSWHHTPHNPHPPRHNVFAHHNPHLKQYLLTKLN